MKFEEVIPALRSGLLAESKSLGFTVGMYSGEPSLYAMIFATDWEIVETPEDKKHRVRNGGK